MSEQTESGAERIAREQKERRRGAIVAITGAIVLFLATVGAVADMVIASGTEVRGGSHGTGPIELQARNFAFVPSSVVVHGSSVTIRITNDGVSEHSFTTDDPPLDIVVQPGQTRTVRVSSRGSPLLEFYCRFHQNYGMQGTISFRS
jgi:plastocyanin